MKKGQVKIAFKSSCEKYKNNNNSNRLTQGKLKKKRKKKKESKTCSFLCCISFFYWKIWFYNAPKGLICWKIFQGLITVARTTKRNKLIMTKLSWGWRRITASRRTTAATRKERHEIIIIIRIKMNGEKKEA